MASVSASSNKRPRSSAAAPSAASSDGQYSSMDSTLTLIALKLGGDAARAIDAYARLVEPGSRDVLLLTRDAGGSADDADWLAAFPSGRAVRILARGACTGALRGMTYTRVAFRGESAAEDVLRMAPLLQSTSADGGAPFGMRGALVTVSFSGFGVDDCCGAEDQSDEYPEKLGTVLDVKLPRWSLRYVCLYTRH